ncbi:MAG: HI0074 family nucleotidyltransferase substrate-binding subunit [Candidatus Binatia bacterium]
MSARLGALDSALARLTEALDAAETGISRDASIQRFEFCFELAWRAIQDHGRDAGLDCRSPKSCLKLAFRQGWIESEAAWLTMLDDRNLTSHTYNEATAREIYGRLREHLATLGRLAAALRSR